MDLPHLVSTPGTLAWWTLLRAISVLNLAAWGVMAWWWHRRLKRDPARWGERRWQLLLSAGYALGCAYRSHWPVFDVPRIVLVDSWLSSVAVGRTVATVAELCFAAQWALLLRESAHGNRSRLLQGAAAAVLPLIALAETCSWYSVLTTSNLGHVGEETLWAVTAALVAAAAVLLLPRSHPPLRPLLAFWALAAAAYVAYMLAVDVPMYWTRWLADEAVGRPYLSVAQGLADVSSRWVVSHRWDVWQSEVVWMTLYFSVAVWLSIGLVHAPRLVPAQHAGG